MNMEVVSIISSYTLGRPAYEHGSCVHQILQSPTKYILKSLWLHSYEIPSGILYNRNISCKVVNVPWFAVIILMVNWFVSPSSMMVQLRWRCFAPIFDTILFRRCFCLLVNISCVEDDVTRLFSSLTRGLHYMFCPCWYMHTHLIVFKLNRFDCKIATNQDFCT